MLLWKKRYESASNEKREECESEFKKRESEYYRVQGELLASINKTVSNAPAYLESNATDENIEKWKEWLKKSMGSVETRKLHSQHYE
jgi:hypothetical protein